MSIKVVPSFATLAMGFLEVRLYQQIMEKYGINAKNHFIIKWWRYLDDCFLIWNTRIDLLGNLLSILQGLRRSIKFTAEERREEIGFLDIKVAIENKKLVTDLYQKPTGSQKCVHCKSYHPSNRKRNIPFNPARHYCTIIEKSSSWNEKLGNLKSCLLKQCYPSGLIDSGIK